MITESAPAKVNLVLQVGRRRDDGLHELCSVFAPLELADELIFEPAERDEVVAPGVDGPNLVQAALDAFRRRAELEPLRVRIDKDIPVAGGLGGGSADAAAALRAANRLAGEPLDLEQLRSLGAGIGADVPSQLDPRPSLVTGAGERVEPNALEPLWLVLVPSAEGLSTAAVYAELDRLGGGREALDPRAAAGPGRRRRDCGRAVCGERPRAGCAVAAPGVAGSAQRADRPGRARRALERLWPDRVRDLRRRGDGEGGSSRDPGSDDHPHPAARCVTMSSRWTSASPPRRWRWPWARG